MATLSNTNTAVRVAGDMGQDCKTVTLFSDAQWYLYQGVGGVKRRDFLLSFLVRAVVRDQPCKVTLAGPATGDQELCWHCERHGGSTAVSGHKGSSNSTQVLLKATALNRVQSCSAESSLSQQHLIRILLSAVPHSSRYNGDNVTGEWTAATSKKDTERMRRQIEVPVQSGQLL